MSKGFVYLLTCSERYKIGFSTFPWMRKTQVKVDTKLPLMLTAMIRGGRDTERETHALFASRKIEGEWFEPCQEVVDWFEGHQDYIYPGTPYHPNWPIDENARPHKSTETNKEAD